MKAFILGLVAALMLGTPAFADETPEQMFGRTFSDLMGTVAEEAGALENKEAPTKDEKKALKAFKKAQKMAGKLASVGIDKKSFKKVGKIFKTLTKVTDTSVGQQAKALPLDLPLLRDALSTLASTLRYAVGMAQDDAEGQKDDLEVDKNVNRIANFIGKAAAKEAGAEDLWNIDGNWAKAWAVWAKAWSGYVKAAVQAAKLYQKENKGGIAGISFDADGKLINTSGKSVQLTDLIYDLRFKVPNVPAQTVKLKLSEISPQSLPIDLGVNAFDPSLYSQVWQGLKFVPGISVSGKIVYQTTAGNLTFNFN